MARKIIYRKGGLNNQSPAPNGYKYVGYDGLTFSEKDGNIISPIGTGSEEVTYYTIDMMDEQEGIIYADHHNFYLTELIKITNNTNVDIKVGGNSINFDPNSKHYVGRGEGISISSDGPCVIQIKVTIL